MELVAIPDPALAIALDVSGVGVEHVVGGPHYYSTCCGRPSWTTCPACITSTRSTHADANGASWVEMRIAVPSADRWRMVAARSPRRDGSSEAGGSPVRSRGGVIANARALATRGAPPAGRSCRRAW